MVTGGTDDAEKIFRPLPEYSSDSLTSIASMCRVGSSEAEAEAALALPVAAALASVARGAFAAGACAWLTTATGAGVDEKRVPFPSTTALPAPAPQTRRPRSVSAVLLIRRPWKASLPLPSIRWSSRRQFRRRASTQIGGQPQPQVHRPALLAGQRHSVDHEEHLVALQRIEELHQRPVI